MERKKFLIAILAVVALFTSLFFALIKKGDMRQNSGVVQKVATSEEKAVEALTEAIQSNEDLTDFVGSIATIGDRTITVGHLEETVVVNMGGFTSVMFVDGRGEILSPGQISDLKMGDFVKVTYGKTTKNASIISVAKSAQVEKKKK